MFHHDPNLYGYKELTPPFHTPYAGPFFTPWQNLPRFVPQVFSHTYARSPFEMQRPVFDVPRTPFDPYAQQVGIDPYAHQMGVNPYAHQMGVNPMMGINPYAHQMGINPYAHQMGTNPLLQPFNLTLPQYGWRPFVY